MGTSRLPTPEHQLSLPLHAPHQAIIEGSDFDGFARTLALACPNLRDISPAQGYEQLRFRMNVLQLGTMMLANGYSDSYQASMEACAARTLFIPQRGTYRFSVQGKTHYARGNITGMFLSGAAIEGGPDSTAGIIFNLDPEKLQGIAGAMTGGRNIDFRLDEDREIPLLSSAIEGSAGTFPELLRQMDAALQTPALIPLLGLDDLLYRHVALLLAPEALLGHDEVKPQSKASRAVVRQICEAIMARLPEAPSLSELEALGGLSTRALQYAFRRYLDCTPGEWIRKQRLERAHARLRQPAESDTVTSIALEEGFYHLGDFSRRFKRLFGEAPSDILRRARSLRT